VEGELKDSLPLAQTYWRLEGIVIRYGSRVLDSILIGFDPTDSLPAQLWVWGIGVSRYQ